MKKHHSDPSKVTSIKIVRQLEEVFGPYSMMFRELKKMKMKMKKKKKK
jgi:hypothetical protein